MKIISRKIGNIIEYGLIEIDTRIGVLEFSYQKGGQDENYQLESTLTRYHELTDEELDEIDNIITKELDK